MRCNADPSIGTEDEEEEEKEEEEEEEDDDDAGLLVLLIKGSKHVMGHGLTEGDGETGSLGMELSEEY